MKKQNVAEAVALLLEKTVNEAGCILWDVEFGKEGADYHLTVTIDKPEGITIDDCERVHHAIDPVLDLADPIEGPYILNVSSPGIERVLKNDFHLRSSLGETCLVKLFAPKDGRKQIKGALASFDEESVTLATELGDLTLLRKEISKISTVYF